MRERVERRSGAVRLVLVLMLLMWSAACSEDEAVGPADGGIGEEMGGWADMAPDLPATRCARDEHVEQNTCVACPAGTANEPDDDASGADTTCDPVLCRADEHVEQNACVACPPGSTNEAGDDASGPNTGCDPVLCQADERVEQNACVVCPAGTMNMAGDDASGTDTACDGVLCPSNQRVDQSACVACPVGTRNEAGDDASGANTACEPVLCQADEYVQQNTCVTCPAGTTNEAGDDASSSDTVCDDACSGIFGILCDQIIDGYLKASNSEADEFFGVSVSLHGDRLTVGAPHEDSCADGVDPAGGQADNGCTSAGAAYLFERDAQTGVWSQRAYLKASNSEKDDFFGGSVSLHGERLAVGAWGEDSCADGFDPVDGQADNGCAAGGAVYLHRLAP